jgi:hypothetical protein
LNKTRKIIKINLFYNFKINYYKNKIFTTNLNIYMFKYNKSKIKTILKEKIGHHRDHEVNYDIKKMIIY